MTTIRKYLRSFTAAATALLIAVVGCVSISAKEFADVSDFSEQIDVLSDIGIIVGTSENEFSPNEKVTREQMALLMFRTMLGRQEAGEENSTKFTDLYDSTYHGAISWANAAGIIIGTSDTTFEPTGGILKQDALTMLVRALGHSNKKMDAGYPWTYVEAAVKLGLDEGLEHLPNTAVLTRGETAAILYNALTAEYLVPKTSNGIYVLETTIAEHVFGFEIGEWTLASTNHYALEGVNTVVKKDYVSLTNQNKEMITVPFAELEVSGDADEWLGRTFRAVTRVEGKNVNVFGSAPIDSEKMFFDAEIKDGYVIINSVKYRLVENKSDILSTNDNELCIFAYGENGTVSQVKTLDALAAKLGAYEIKLITSDEHGALAILKPYSLGKLNMTANGINIAGGLKAEELTGGFDNKIGAENGNFVLYYFNTANRELEIKSILNPTAEMLVSRLTNDSATIGGVSYKLGNSAMGIEASTIASQLSVGKNASVIVYDNCVLAVINPAEEVITAKYLVVTGNSVPVYVGGNVRYAMTANIDGQSVSIVSTTANTEAGKVYRYTVDANDVYTLIGFESSSFAVNGDIAMNETISENTVVSTGSKPYFTIAGKNFVTDADSVIVVNGEKGWNVKKGVFTADITIAANAKVTAIFADNTGDVETLRYMFIDNATLGRTDVTTGYVKVLAANGTEYINGTVYNVYSALNLTTGKIENYHTLESGIAAGAVRVISANGEILATEGQLLSGTVNGFTSSTVTIGDNTYAITSQTLFITVKDGTTVESIKLGDLVGKTVEFMADNNTVGIIIG